VKSGSCPYAPMCRIWTVGPRGMTAIGGVARARAGDRREPFKRLLRLTSRPRQHFIFSKISIHPNFEI
jgi:hypothetical protein